MGYESSRLRPQASHLAPEYVRDIKAIHVEVHQGVVPVMLWNQIKEDIYFLSLY